MLYMPCALAADDSKPVAAIEPISMSSIVSVVLGMVVILLLIFVMAWAVKKMHLTPQSRHQLINILSAVSVGQRERIALVQVGEEQFVVGIAPGRIQTLHNMHNAVDVSDTDTSGSTPFAEKLGQLMGQRPDRKGVVHD
jgi:flagellar protein FliO/FliZ